MADGFFSLFNQKLIFPGIGDQQTLRLVSALGGEQQVQTQSLHLQSNPNPFAGFRPRTRGVTYSTTWRPRLAVDEVARGRPGCALLISRSSMTYTTMVRWFHHRLWSQIARANRSVYGETVRPGLQTSSSSGTAIAPTIAGYDGPTICADASGPTEIGTWIANGTQSPERQFGPPQVLQRAQGSALGVGEPSAYAGRPIAQSSRIELRDLAEEETVVDDTEVPIATQTEVRILGPVEIVGWRNAPDRPVLTELVCYLALHRDRPISSDGLRAALRPYETDKEQSAKTLRTYVSLLRKALGPDVLPNATSAGYQLAATVATDWDRFRELSEMPDLQSKLEALKLIRGRPFEGVPADGYPWVFTEFWISDIEVAVVAQAREVARLCREARGSDDALLALRQGLLAVRSDFTLWDMYLAFASEAGEAALRRAQREARAALGDDAPS